MGSIILSLRCNVFRVDLRATGGPLEVNQTVDRRSSDRSSIGEVRPLCGAIYNLNLGRNQPVTPRCAAMDPVRSIRQSGWASPKILRSEVRLGVCLYHWRHFGADQGLASRILEGVCRLREEEGKRGCGVAIGIRLTLNQRLVTLNGWRGDVERETRRRSPSLVSPKIRVPNNVAPVARVHSFVLPIHPLLRSNPLSTYLLKPSLRIQQAALSVTGLSIPRAAGGRETSLVHCTDCTLIKTNSLTMQWYLTEGIGA